MATPCMHAAGPVCSEQYVGVWYGRLQQCEGTNGLLADLLLWTWVSSGEGQAGTIIFVIQTITTNACDQRAFIL